NTCSRFYRAEVQRAYGNSRGRGQLQFIRPHFPDSIVRFWLGILPARIRQIVEVVAARRQVGLNQRKCWYRIFERSSVSATQIEKLMTGVFPLVDQLQLLWRLFAELDVKLNDRQIDVRNPPDWRTPHLDTGGNRYVNGGEEKPGFGPQ